MQDGGNQSTVYSKSQGNDLQYGKQFSVGTKGVSGQDDGQSVNVKGKIKD